VVRGQHHAPAALNPRERPGIHCTGGWVGPRAGPDRCGKSHLTGIWSLDRPACSQSLYRLNYPAHRWGNTSNFKSWFCFVVWWAVLSCCRYIFGDKKQHNCLRIADLSWFRSMLLYIHLLIVFALGNVQQSLLYDPKEQWVIPSRWKVVNGVENLLTICTPVLQLLDPLIDLCFTHK
jgi:hypothetical protein